MKILLVIYLIGCVVIWFILDKGKKAGAQEAYSGKWPIWFLDLMGIIFWPVWVVIIIVWGFISARRERGRRS